MHIKKSSFLLLALTLFISVLQAQETQSAADVDHGWGRVARIKNDTDFNMDVFFDKGIHDALPDGTIVCLRSLDPTLGKDGKLLRVIKDGSTFKLVADGVSTKELATQFTVKRYLAPDLTDWLGLQSPTANNSLLGIDPTTFRATLSTKESAFNDETATAISTHWRVDGDGIADCRLASRVTGAGFIQNMTLEEEYVVDGQKDTEIVTYATDLWVTNYPQDEDIEIINAEYGPSQPFYTVDYATFGRKDLSLPDGRVRDIRDTIRARIDKFGAIYTLHPGWNPTEAFFAPDKELEAGSWKSIKVSVTVMGNRTITAECNMPDQYNIPETQIFDKEKDNARIKELRTKYSEAVKTAILKDLRQRGEINWQPGEIQRKVGNPCDGLRSDKTIVQDLIVNLTINGKKVTIRGNDKDGVHYTLTGDTYSLNNQSTGWDRKSSDMKMTAVGNSSAEWGIDNKGRLYRHAGKNIWELKSGDNAGITFISATVDGDVFYIDSANRVSRRAADGTVTALDTKFKAQRVSARTPQDVWAINMNNKLCHYNGTSWSVDESFDYVARDVSVAYDGTVWATDADYKLYRGVNGEWQACVDCDAARGVAARNANEVFVVAPNRSIFKYTYKKGKSALPSGTFGTQVVAASGYTKSIQRAARAKRTITVFTTRDQDNKAAGPTAAANMRIEIVKLGMGGGIPAHSSNDLARILAAKNPRISGFAKYVLPGVTQGSLIKVNPLRSQGAAWLNTALPVSSSAAVSFSARPGDKGDIQVIFGQQISDSFVYKVIIGGDGNTRAKIVRRTFDTNGKPVDTVVSEVTRRQNPLAAAVPGTFTPYWVSINKGLILAGVGNIGDNAFIAWRDPDPADDINMVGFGSHKMTIDYTSIQVMPAVDAQGNPREYKQEPDSFSPAAGKQATQWLTSLPFRVIDRGSVAVTVQAASSATLILGTANSLDKPHYAVVFGDDSNKKISLKKWAPGAKEYVERASLSYATYPDLALDANKAMRFWVSYNGGAIALGAGQLGENTLLVIQDLNSLTGVCKLGVASFDKAPATFSEIAIGEPIDFGVINQLAGYSRIPTSFQYAGDMTIITPFDYKFAQVEQSVKLTDLVNDATYYAGGTPQQGALYDFMVSISDDGTPKLILVGDPTNPAKRNIEQQILKVQADADFARASQDFMNQDATIAKNEKIAQAVRIVAVADAQATALNAQAATALEVAQGASNVKRATAEGMQLTAATASAAGSQIAGLASTSLNPIIAAVGLGAGTALIASGVALNAASAAVLTAAAEEDAKGVTAAASIKNAAANAVKEAAIESALTTEQAATIEAEKQRKALERAYQAADLDRQAKLLAGQASAFRAIDSYVYTDQAPRTALGSASIPQEAIDNKAALLQKLNEVAAKRPSTKETFEELLSVYKIALNLITQFSVIDNKATRSQIFDAINSLITAYQNLYGSDTDINEGVHNDLINLLMAARNNPYLIDANNPDEAKLRENWFVSITQLSRQLLSAGKSHSITLNSTYGEYVWFTETASTQDVVELSFDAKGINDIFIGFVSDTVPVRNSPLEFYEVVLGAWDNERNVVRLQSLDRSAYEVNKKTNPAAMLTRMEFEHYTITFDHGKISATKGTKNIPMLTWQDPYPITGLTRVGIATWNSPITFKNIMLNGKQVGKQDTNLAALSTSDPTAAINQAVDLFAEIEALLGTEVMETTDDVDAVRFMDTLEENIMFAAQNGFTKRRTMTTDALTDFWFALDACDNWLVNEANYKKVQFYMKTITTELAKKGVTVEAVDDTHSKHQSVANLAATASVSEEIVEAPEEKVAAETQEAAAADSSEATIAE